MCERIRTCMSSVLAVTLFFVLPRLSAAQSEATRLTDNPRDDENPSWKPGAETIIYSALVDDTEDECASSKRAELYQVQSTGSGETLIGKGCGGILYTGWAGQNQLYIGHEGEVELWSAGAAPFTFNLQWGFNEDKSESHRRLLVGGLRGFATSRDGSTALWVGLTEEREVYEIRTASVGSLDGQNMNEVGTVVLDELHHVPNISVLPDGSGFVMDQIVGSGHLGGRDLFHYTIDGTLVRRLTTSGETDGRNNTQPQVSPDGSAVAYSEGSRILFTVPLSRDSPPQEVVGTEEWVARRPSWSPDGSRLAFQGFVDSQFDIFAVGVSSGGFCPVGKDGLAPATIIVNSPGNQPLRKGAVECDTGGPKVGGDPECTLRAAIRHANNVNAERGCGVDIRFSEPHVIQVSGESLPSMNGNITIDGRAGDDRATIDGNGHPGSGLTLNGQFIRVSNLDIRRFGQYGIYVNGATEVIIKGNRIGAEPPELNERGGILIENGSVVDSLGGRTHEESNAIGGGVQIEGEAVHVLRNDLWIPADRLDNLSGALLDVVPGIGQTGPSCQTWKDPAKGEVWPTPRILNLSSLGANGYARRIGADVIAYRVEDVGSGRGKHFPRSVVAIGVATAGSDGEFEIVFDSPVQPGRSVAVSASGPDGNTTEISQLTRPVIYLPGVGGSLLEGRPNDNLWPPPPTVFNQNQRFARLAMNSDGSEIEPVLAIRVLDSPNTDLFDDDEPYLAITSFLASRVELWKMPYDWRRSPFDLAADLDDLVSTIMETSEAPKTCEVDIAAHSNGGMVAQTFLNRFPVNSQRVRRMITSGTPYLGTPKVVQAHTTGYVFDVEERLRWDANWPVITQTFRNLPDAYSLMPSEQYFESVASGTSAWYMVDPLGRPLTGYAASIGFLASPKDEGGLGLNRPMWEQEQNRIHDRHTDFRGWDRPPQIFRMVGNLGNVTARRFQFGYPPRLDRFWSLVDPEPSRVQPDDPPGLFNHRTFLRPDTRGSQGDGTVTLGSATLGRFGGGAADFSGVDTSPWIEEFEFFPCRHLELVDPGCSDNAAIERTVELLWRGNLVLGEPGAKRPRLAADDGEFREFVEVSASEPVVVVVERSDGAKAGPLDAEKPNLITYQLPEIVYWTNGYVASISLPIGGAYAVTTHAQTDQTSVRISRDRISDAGNDIAFFEDVVLADGGTAQLSFEAAGTSLETSMQVDENGDGTVDREAVPKATASGVAGDLGIPYPTPIRVEVEVLEGASPFVRYIQIPGSGGDWQWTINDSPSWIVADKLSGDGPDEIQLTIDPSGFPRGTTDDAFQISLRLHEYEVAVSLIVRIAVVDELEPAGSIGLTWEAPTDGEGSPPSNLAANPRSSATKSGGVKDDIEEMEPNNAFSQAQEVGGAAPLVIDGDIGSGDDTRDIFVFTTEDAGLKVNLDDVTADCDLTIHQNAGGGVFVVVEASRNDGESSSEEIDIPELPAGTYYAQVRYVSNSGVATNYGLTLDGDFGEGGQESGVLAYAVYRSTVPNAFATGSKIADVVASMTSFDDSELPAGTYFYQLTAVYESGESQPSNEVSTSLPVSPSGAETREIPTTRGLYQNYPNPFSDQTTIGFELQEPDVVRLAVHDLLGRVLDVIAEGYFSAGRHQVLWDAIGHESGIYFYRLQTSARTETRPMFVVNRP